MPEAAQRSGLSPEIVMRVMRAESGGKTRIVSAKGAIGCMQIMQSTWAYLTARYSLGPDPFDPRMNMIGGAMYLAELATRYGWPGALSAYNAGPGRYLRYVQGGIPLPTETIAYTARLGGNAEARPAPAPVARWQEARLFIARPTFEGGAEPPPAPGSSSGIAEVRPPNTLFPLVNPPKRPVATSAGP
ncbi:MAG: lytic transglycosylase protein [Sphingomonadales bacterium]|nr:lytic transglycosylase protein [Sphingomonadales bacterium]